MAEDLQNSAFGEDALASNTTAVRNSTFQEAIRDQISGIDQLNPNPELNRIFYDGLRAFETLPNEEQRRFATYLTSVLRRYENLIYQTRQGTLDPDACAGAREHLRFVFSQPGTIVWWRQAKNLFNQELVEFVERDLA